MIAASFPLTPDGCWCDLRRADDGRVRRPSLFLDRDGVVVEERDYLRHVAELRLIDGAGATIAAANRHGWLVVLVSNQSGIARGRLTWQDFAALQDALYRQLEAHGAHVDLVLACPFLPGSGHSWRKPAPGMLIEAARRLAIDMPASWMVGDKADDLRAAQAAGLAHAAHVLTGHGATERSEAAGLRDADFSVELWEGIADAARLFGDIRSMSG